jgi:glutaredoxin
MIIIYGKPDCGYCTKAKKLADDIGVVYEYRDVFDGDNMMEMMEAAPGAKTVPQIFEGFRYIGGYTEFYQEFLSGKFAS